MGSPRSERKVVAVCHALSHLICSAAPVSKEGCEIFVCCEPKGSPGPEEPRMGVAVGVGMSTSLGGGKTEAKIWSWRAVIVANDEGEHCCPTMPRTSGVQSAFSANHEVTCHSL